MMIVMLAAAVFAPFCFAEGADDSSGTNDPRFAGFPGKGLHHDAVFSGYDIHHGIDVSAHQKEVDWKAVAEAGAEFVFIRVGYRGYSTGLIVEDAYAARNLKGAIENGLKVGVYLFSQAITVEEGIEEADFVLKLLKKYGLGPANIQLPIVYDVEYPSSDGKYVGRLYEANLGRALRTEIALAFLERAREAGYDACFYGSRSALSNQTKAYMNRINGVYPVWLAVYSTGKRAGYSGPYTFWQYSSKGKVSGISGDVDLDVWYEDPKTASGWRQEDGRIYYTDPEKKLSLTGWQALAGRHYYFAEDGTMLTYWQDIDGSRYYFGQNGEMRQGWEAVGGERYYFNARGEMQTGWQTISDSLYYFGADGAMLRGLQRISGGMYLFTMDGKLLAGAFPDDTADPGQGSAGTSASICYWILGKQVSVKMPFGTGQ